MIIHSCVCVCVEKRFFLNDVVKFETKLFCKFGGTGVYIGKLLAKYTHWIITIQKKQDAIVAIISHTRTRAQNKRSTCQN